MKIALPNLLTVLLTVVVSTALFGQQTLVTGTITGPFCAGDAVSVPYTASGPFSNTNEFTAQLSDANGNFGGFGGGTAIGTIISDVSGVIPATIPTDEGPGNGYRIRVVSNDPQMNGDDNGTDLTINPLPGETGEILGSRAVCEGEESLVIEVQASDNADTYTWTVSNGLTINSGQGTTVLNVAIGAGVTGGSVSVVASNSCGDSRNPVMGVQMTAPNTEDYQFSGTGGWGGSVTTDLVAEVAYEQDIAGNYTGCDEYAPGTFTGKIALIDRGSCNFSLKVYNAQVAGAVGVVVVNNQGGNPFPMGAGDFSELVTIPAVMITIDDGDAIKQELGNGTVEMALIGNKFEFEVVSGPSAGTILGKPAVEPYDVESYSLPFTDGLMYNWMVAGGNILSGNGTNVLSVQWGNIGVGTVQVSVSDDTGCEGDTSQLQVAISNNPTGVADLGVPTITVAPNPTNGLVQLYCAAKNANNITLFNSLGSQVAVKAIPQTPNHFLIDMRELVNGVYFLQVNYGGKVYAKKLILTQ